MDDLWFGVLFSSSSDTTGRLEEEHEKLCPVESCLLKKTFYLLRYSYPVPLGLKKMSHGTVGIIMGIFEKKNTKHIV